MLPLREGAVFLCDVLCLAVKGLILNAIAFYQTFIHPRSPKNVENQVILITGGGGGLGKEMALRLAKFGAILVLWDINEISVEKVARKIESEGGKAYFYKCDISNVDEVDLVVSQVKNTVRQIDILINNAGIFHSKPILQLSPGAIRKTIQVNLLSHYWTIRHFLPDMLKRNSGHIVAVSSIAGQFGSVHMVDYCGSKFGVVGLMEALEEELAFLHPGHNVKLTTLLPSAFENGLAKDTSTRSQLLMPVLKLEEVASMAVDAILREETQVTLPRRIGVITKCVRMIASRSAEKEAQRFCEYIPHQH